MENMNGNALLVMWREWLRRYVVVTPAQELVLALWCLHTWLYERLGRATPYLELTGVSGSGKTTIMEACGLLCRGSLVLNTLRTLAMARRIEETNGHVTFFIDEAERLESASFGDQRSMLASGYRQGGVHLVTVGKQTELKRSYCPKAFTSLRTLTGVLHNRCIPIWVDRGSPVAKLGLEYERAEATAAELINQFKLVMKNTERILTVEPAWLTSERDTEIWTPLFSLAATLQVDQQTTDELTRASVDLSALRGVPRRMDVKVEDEAAKERSYAVRLLQDVKTLIQPGETFIPSTALVERLHALPTGPWRSYQLTGLTEITLAQLLGAFGIGPVAGHIGKGRKQRQFARGYKVSAINAAKS